MPEFTIEMLWDCAVCKAKRNLGLERHCRNCGHPKDDRDPEYMPDNVTVADALEGDKRRRGLAGPDWKCAYCGSLQNPLNKCCTECGVPQGEKAKKAWEAPVTTATFEPTTGTKTSSETHTEHVEEPKRDTPVKAFTAGYRDNAADLPIPRLSMSLAAKRALIIGPPAIILFGLLLWLVFRTKVVDAHVTAISWTHSVKIERYQVWHHDGWYPEQGAFNVQNDGRRIHHYDHVKVGSHTENYTARVACGSDCRTVRGSCTTTPVRCTSNRNGTANCSGGDRVCDPDRQECTTRYCDEPRTRSVDDYEDQPRYQDYYEWDVWDWGYNRTVVSSGSTTQENWPSDDALKPTHLNTGEQERESGRVADHDVTFSDGKDSWHLHPSTCVEFERYPVGGAWRIKVGLAHGVEVLQAK